MICLEIDVVKEGRALTLFVCHFKSMHGGRKKTNAIRTAEARAVRAIIEARFSDPASAEWIILGDFNDYTEIDGVPVATHGLAPLLEDGFTIDLAGQVLDDPLDTLVALLSEREDLWRPRPYVPLAKIGREEPQRLSDLYPRWGCLAV